jgi:hypothetical protein
MPKLMIVTLDYNCLIALEEEREPEASALRELAALCKSKGIKLTAYTYVFLENPKPEGKRAQPSELKTRLETVGLSEIELIGPGTLYTEVDGYLTSEYHDELMQQAHDILFPGIHYYFQDYLKAECEKGNISLEDIWDANHDKLGPPIPWSPEEAHNPPPSERLDDGTKQQLRDLWDKLNRKWNNAKSDSLALCAHLAEDKGIFVTSDKNFLKKRDRLRKIAPDLKILTPAEALEELKGAPIENT